MSDFMERARKAGLARMGKDTDTDWTVDESKAFFDFLAGAEWARDHLTVQDTDAGDLVAVSWTDCDCEWETAHCDEHHRRTTRIPRSVLTRAAAEYETGEQA